MKHIVTLATLPACIPTRFCCYHQRLFTFFAMRQIPTNRHTQEIVGKSNRDEVEGKIATRGLSFL